MSERSEARIALVGDYGPAVVAHQGIQRSLVLATSRMPGLTWEWIHTTAIGADPASRLAGFTGVWVVPASPYANPEGAFAAIRYAREWPLPDRYLRRVPARSPRVRPQCPASGTGGPCRDVTRVAVRPYRATELRIG